MCLDHEIVDLSEVDLKDIKGSVLRKILAKVDPDANQQRNPA